MLIISRDQVKKIIPLSKIGDVVKEVEKAFLDYSNGGVQMPPKNYLYFKKYNGDLRIMPAYSDELDVAGTKIVNVHPDNPKKNMLTVMASILLNDAKTGIPISLMDGTYITGMRTGAVSAVASKYLAKKDAKTLGVIGAGQQAVFQIMAILKIRPIKRILVADVRPEAIKALKNTLIKERVKIESSSAEEAAKQDILVTVTPARGPVVKREWILPGTHINAIGADAEGKEELDPQILKDAKIVIDDRAQATHSGEINVPLKNGIITESDIYGMLGEIISGKIAGRVNDKEITVFDSTGLGVQDLYTAYYVYRKAKAGKIGREFKTI